MSNTTVSAAAEKSSPGMFFRIVKTEFKKCFDTRTAFVLVLVALVLTLCMSALCVMMLKSGNRWFGAFDTVAMPLNTFLPVLIILLFCEEWDKGGALVSFLQVPKRWLLICAKCLVSLSLMVFVYVLSLILCAGAALIASSARGIDITWSFPVWDLFCSGLPVFVNLGLGMAFALFTRSSVMALSGFYVIPSVTSILASIPAISDIFCWITLGHSSTLLATPLIELSAIQILVSMLLWIALPAVIGFIHAIKCDVA